MPPRNRILVLLPVLGQPRHAKRIAMLRRQGFSVDVAAFVRDYHSGRLPEGPVAQLGTLEPGRYVKRAWTITRALPRLRASIRGADLVYAFGSDMAMAAMAAGAGLDRPVVLEVGDLRPVQTAPDIGGRIARLVDRSILRGIGLLVVTAPGFVDGYYAGRAKRLRTLVIENKVDPSEVARMDERAAIHPDPEVGGRIRIGYFGLLRCRRSWEVLERLAESGFDVVVAGRPQDPQDLPARAERHPNVSWLGEYRSPDDLQRLYGSIDLLWGCYPHPAPHERNWRWARTNRFYEGCYFRKPIVALAGSADAAVVERYDIGLTVSLDDVSKAVDAVSRVSRGDLARWSTNLERLPRETCEVTNEEVLLRDELRRVIASAAD